MSIESNDGGENSTSTNPPVDLTYTYAKFNVRSGDGKNEEVEIGGEGASGLYKALQEFLSSCEETGKQIDPESSKIGLSMNSYPNTLFPIDNEGYGVEDFQHPEAVSFINMGGGTAIDLARILGKIAKFWEEHEKDFRQFWFELAIEARRNFIRIVCPQMPESVSDPTFTLNGVSTRVEGAALLMPYMTVEVLQRGRALSNFLQEGVQDTFADYVRCNIFSLRQISTESNQVKYDLQKVQDHENGTRTHYHVFSFNPPYHYEMKAPQNEVSDKKSVAVWEKKNIQALMEAEMACTDYEYDLIRNMISLQIMLLANIVDEYRHKVLKKTDFPKTMSPILRCLQCDDDSKKKLLICSRCKVARYCRYGTHAIYICIYVLIHYCISEMDYHSCLNANGWSV